MSPKVLVDTSFVVALINARDTHHPKTTQLSREFEGCPLVITDAVLFEIGNALARSFKSQAISIIDDFISSPEVEVIRTSPILFTEAFATYSSHDDKDWGLVDCVSFIVMRQQKIASALTSDQHFIQAGFNALMR